MAEALARTVQLFLMGGWPHGRIKCSLDNWVGKVYLIPRTEIPRSKDRLELSQTGIYLLFGTDTETGDELLYVGQARERKNGDGVFTRVAEHIGDEKLDYFTHAILIIDSDNSFGPTEISYLENAFYQQALVADRVPTVNSNDPSPGNVTEEKQAALDEFMATAKILIGSLGYRLGYLTGDHGAELVRESLVRALRPLPEQLRHTLTWDQGAEMAEHKAFTVTTGMDVYFCDPGSP